MFAQTFLLAAALRMALLSYPWSASSVAPSSVASSRVSGFLDFVDLTAGQSQGDETAISINERVGPLALTTIDSGADPAYLALNNARAMGVQS